MLYEWLAYYQLEPFGDEWLRHSITACQFYNAHRGKNQPQRRPEDFMPIEPRPQTPEQIHRILSGIPIG